MMCCLPRVIRWSLSCRDRWIDIESISDEFSRRLDVSDLEAPEPLIRAISALELLGEGEYFHLIHRMAPCRLYAYMEQHALSNTTREGVDGNCELFAWHQGDAVAEQRATTQFDGLKEWQS